VIVITKKFFPDLTMMHSKKIAFIISINIFFWGNGEVVSEIPSAGVLLERAKEEIYRLNFDAAYGFLTEIRKKYPDVPYKKRVLILKNIVSLGQTFSNLRLFSAYHQGRSLYKKEEETGDSLSPFKLLDSHRSEYLKRIQKWAKRLRSDTKESSRISQEIELSLKYPGAAELSYFVKVGIDNLENIKKGIPPTPSQTQNIEEFEDYSGVLSVIFLCIQEEFQLPQKTMLIQGRVNPELLIYYSRLWLNKALRLTGQKQEWI
jgi:hypothetical protein